MSAKLYDLKHELKKDNANCLSIFENQIQDQWFNTIEAAKYLKISPKCLLNLTSNGKIKYYKFGRRNRYLESDLKKLLLAQPRGVSNGS